MVESVKQSVEEVFRQNMASEGSSLPNKSGMGSGDHHHRNQGERTNPYSYACHTQLSRIEFPRFDGTNVKEWLYQCETYFMVDNTQEEFKVKLAIMHFEGKALKWHHAYVRSMWVNSLPTWGEYVKTLIERFGEVYDDPIAELMKLRQKGTIVEYHKEFDVVITRLDRFEDYILSCFLSGLKNDVQMMVRMFQPQTVRKAFTLAKLYEVASHTIQNQRRVKNPSYSNTGGRPLISSKPALTTDSEGLKEKTRFSRSLTPAYMNDRRAKGLCYFCDETYTPEHSLTHKKLQVHLLEVDELEDEEVELGGGQKAVIKSSEEPHISVNALTRVANFRTMRVTGRYNKKPLHIQIDSGSTRNFLDRQVAERIGCRIEELQPILVPVADGTKVPISSVVRNFSWTLQQSTFTSYVMLLPLGCCDVVLGIEWLITLGDITWNFNKLTMEFCLQGRRHVLRGATQFECKSVKAQQLEKAMLMGVHLSMIQVGNAKGGLLHTLTTHADSSQIPPTIECILQAYADVFANPTQLPATRAEHDHRIPLMHNMDPVNKRPYRYAKEQKDVIDKLVHDMLSSGVIQTSNSPYASPVVLAGKKDGTWRLCVDYRELNKDTIKDKFLIPLVDDLMDELHGFSIFSKIDMRADYHQVRMSSNDVHKTAFRTHSGHFEYLLMPFGLTNAPTTFHNLTKNPRLALFEPN
ncbi:PREDICTED: uncharacterized protein LOC109330865 [Lupinus angustifolius]|uniref:uncharacterized protein LOC109330865 n=1 Tax=Lupinus angustifolius TaxID=3871 RepID=UPI00092FD165|nr:PREDICTED: uncharacterized protein LOC109330865 [Lupinus angustifolius]